MTDTPKKAAITRDTIANVLLIAVSFVIGIFSYTFYMAQRQPPMSLEAPIALVTSFMSGLVVGLFTFGLGLCVLLVLGHVRRRQIKPGITPKVTCATVVLGIITTAIWMISF